MTWSVVKSKDGHMHVLPDKDERVHVTAATCWCQPTLEDFGWWTHHAADKREMREKQ